jgi:hypothetical protein
VQWQRYRSKGGAAVVAEPRVSASALARLEMAREKTGMARMKPDRRERLGFPSEPEASVITPVRMPLRATVGRIDQTIGWRPHRWRDADNPRPVVLNSAMVSRIAQHLKAREWARAMGKRLSTPFGSGLEEWAETWKRNKELEERRLVGSPTPQGRKRPA